MNRAFGVIALAFALAFPAALLLAATGYAAYFFAALLLPEGGPAVMFATLWLVAFALSLAAIWVWRRAKFSFPKKCGDKEMTS
jgi:hypothetical protein